MKFIFFVFTKNVNDYLIYLAFVYVTCGAFGRKSKYAEYDNKVVVELTLHLLKAN